MSFSVYPEYKNSSNPWLQVMPKHWVEAHLRWLASIYAGGTPDKKQQDYWSEGTIPWLNSGSVNNALVTKPSAMITEEAYAKSSAKWIPEGALLIALAGQGKTKGKVAQLAFPATCNQSMAAIVPEEEVQGRYLFWWLESNYQNIRSLGGGDLRDGLNLEMVGGIGCPVPPIEEQKIIASFLDHETARIDALVGQQQRLIELLKEKRLAVISHAVTKGLDPNVPMKDSGVSGLPLVPSHWQVMNFGLTNKKATLGGNYNSSEELDGIPIIKMGNISRGSAVLSKVERLAADDFIEKEHELKYGDFLFNTRNSLDLVGKVCVWKEELKEAAYNSNVLRIDFSSSLVSSSFYMSYLFNSSLLIGLLRTYAKGTTSVAAIYYKDLQSIPIPLPPKNEQVEIVRYLDSEIDKFDRLYFEAKNIINVIKERRSALISAAVTGKIDVRGWQPPTDSTVSTEATQTEMV